MKGNGLSSTTRTLLRKANRQATFATHEQSFLASKEKQKSLRMQAEKAQLERQKRDLQRQEQRLVPLQPGESSVSNF
ncbi:MAG: hypothetical protein H7222_11735 [Methylotenera sp.]|nr:hypothetical protein [Oligoflexia bacterium]